MIRKFLLGLLLLTPLSVYPLLRNNEARNEYDPFTTQPQADPLTPDQHLALGCLSILPGLPFPGCIPWEPMRDLGQQESRALEELAEKDPVEFLQQALNRYAKEVHGYRCIFDKQEKVNGKLRQKESIRVHFREQPFSVHMDWIKGEGRAVKSLYDAGENDNVLAVRLSRIFPVILHKKLTDPEVMATSRFGVTKFGMYFGAKDTVDTMREAAKKNTLHVSYQGIERPKELGNRLCYKFIRTPYDSPEGLAKENLNELTIYIDMQTRLQVGSVLKDTAGKLIAEYFFREIELNPTFDEKQFALDSL